MVQHSIVTMFQVFLALVTIALIAGTAALLKTTWQRYVASRFHRHPADDASEARELFSEPQSPPTAG